MTDFLEQFFRQLDVPTLRQTVSPGRENILARLDPDPPDPRQRLIVWDAHQDTVPVEGMTIDPWEPRVAGDRVYGRGACDVKGGMASMLTAFAELAAERPGTMPSLVLACTVNEENGFTGAEALAALWSSGPSDFFPRPPAQVIVAEPTDLQVVVAHKGVIRWRCHTRGRAAHSATPDQGENAIYHMGHVLVALEQYAQQLAATLRDPRLGPATMNVGTVRGGLCVNAVPDMCSIELDRRVLPAEDPHAAREEIVRWLAAQVRCAERLHHDPPFLVSGGLSDQRNQDLARRLQQLLGRCGCAAQCVGVPYGTNAPLLAGRAIPTVVFGPGSIAQAHTADEWISIESLQAATQVFRAIGRGETLPH